MAHIKYMWTGVLYIWIAPIVNKCTKNKIEIKIAYSLLLSNPVKMRVLYIRYDILKLCENNG